MFRSYLIVALRNLLKNKVFSTVNILGLAIGTAACFFIFLYVHFELSYDMFHKNAADLYRVNISYSGSFSNLPPMASNHPAVGPAMKADFPEVVDFARAVNTSLFGGASTVSYTDQKSTVTTFNENKMFFVDPSFFTLFSLSFVAGNAASVLEDKNAIVLSQNTAKKYFANEDPLGKILYINKQMPFKVTGIFKDVPENSHIKFDMLISFDAIDENFGFNNWTWPEFYNYILLAPGTNPQKLEARFPEFIDKYLGSVMKQLNFGCEFHLQPITSIHLNSTYLKEPEATGSRRDIYFLTIIGVFILIVAWINYVNLTTAKSMERAKEVGLRKVAGAERAQLITQFISESLLINLLAVLVAALIIFSCFPFFSRFVGKNISQEFLASGLLSRAGFWLTVIAIFITGAVIVGAYPAFVLIRYKPALVLKGKFTQSAKGIFLRKTLVSIQFVLSILLIAGTIVVYKQLSFMQNRELGYDKDQILIVKAPITSDTTFGSKVNAFKNELLKHPSISGISGSSDIPGRLIVGKNTVRRASDDKTHNFITYIMQADEAYVNTYQIQLAAGRNFTKTDTTSIFRRRTDVKIIVNEEVVKALGYKSNEAALGQDLIFAYGNGEKMGEIIGIVKNYHQRSLKELYDPILYVYPSGDFWSFLSVHLNTKDLSRNLTSVQNAYKTIFNDSPFEYFFLNDFFNNQYQADQRFGKVFSLFTMLAIFVACLGLLGLSSFLSRLRTKEIGVRKVLGASVYSIMVLLGKDYLRLILLASVIASPIIYYATSRWLENYAFHIKLSWTMFVLPPLVLLLIALMAISIQSLKSALGNPVASIRTE
jgi:putative ABC transport system permease protein